MIKVIETPAGDLVFADGNDQFPVEDADVAAILRELTAVQEDLETAPADQIVGMLQRNVLRVLIRAVATLGLGAQQLSDDLEEVADAASEAASLPPSLDGYLLFSVDEIQLAMEPLGAVTQLLLATAQRHPTSTPEEQQMAQSYHNLAQAIGGLTATFGYKLEAHRAAHVEGPEGAGGDSDENEEGEGEGDEDGDENDEDET
jgi:hypothetical protein